MTMVTDDEVKAANDTLARNIEDRSAAQSALARAIERVPEARQWARLDKESTELNQKIQAAAARERNADRIREQNTRLTELEAAIPVIRQLLKLRRDIKTSEETVVKGQDAIKALEGAINSKQLRDEITRDQSFLDAANEVKELKDELNDFDPDLASNLETSQARVQAKTDAITKTLEAKASASGILEKARERQKEFAKVGIGVKCSRCGQKVTAKHAQDEREELAEEIARLEEHGTEH